MTRIVALLALLLFLSACSDNPGDNVELPMLPAAVANNAVAAVTVDSVLYLVSFAGIGDGLTHEEVHARTFVLKLGDSNWREVDAVPGKDGRLAATAVSIGPLAYVLGGYTVAADGDEISTPWVHAFDPENGEYTELAPMPVPVDDAVSFTYRERYIYLVSGWHDLGNVNLVQRYDVETDRWDQATPIPGASLFGHAGGIVGENILYCDGVKVQAHKDKSRSFVASDECWHGIINAEDSRRIDWRPVTKHPGLPRYRMAAAGIQDTSMIAFVGGSENPYNFNGIGYDGSPSEPVEDVLLYSLIDGTWSKREYDAVPTMDHRGLVQVGNQWVTVGGIEKNQRVSSKVKGYKFD